MSLKYEACIYNITSLKYLDTFFAITVFGYKSVHVSVRSHLSYHIFYPNFGVFYQFNRHSSLCYVQS